MQKKNTASIIAAPAERCIHHINYIIGQSEANFNSFLMYLASLIRAPAYFISLFFM